MALIVDTLASQLASRLMPTVDTEVAIQNLVDSWSIYFQGAMVGPTGIIVPPPGPGSPPPPPPTPYDAALAAMKSAALALLPPPPPPGQPAPPATPGGVIIQAAITQFWVAMNALAVTVWVTAPVVIVPPVTPPPAVGTIATQLDGPAGVFQANTIAELNLEDAAMTVAAVMHASGGLGALIPGSVPPAPPVPIPIL